MEKITKDNKGITMIALMITVMLIVIIGSVSIYTGIDTYKFSKVTKFITQMQLLQAKIDDLVETKTAEELNNMGLLEVTTEEQTNAIVNAFKQGEVTTADTSKYKVFTKEKVLEILDVEDVQNDIMVNFETREIVSLNSVEDEGNTYYTQYKIPGGQTLINKTSEPSRMRNYSLETSIIDGLNAKIIIGKMVIANCSIRYKYENDNYWQTITNYTEIDGLYEVYISKSGNYIFEFEDNTDGHKTTVDIKIALINQPKTEIEFNRTEYNYALGSDHWVFKEKDGVNYLWIPRFVYKYNNNTNKTEIKFIKGNSNIATDNTYIDNTWNVHSRFATPEGSLLTGLWIEIKEGVGTISGLDMITLLNDTTRNTLVEI